MNGKLFTSRFVQKGCIYCGIFVRSKRCHIITFILIHLYILCFYIIGCCPGVVAAELSFVFGDGVDVLGAVWRVGWQILKGEHMLHRHRVACAGCIVYRLLDISRIPDYGLHRFCGRL